MKNKNISMFITCSSDQTSNPESLFSKSWKLTFSMKNEQLFWQTIAHYEQIKTKSKLCGKKQQTWFVDSGLGVRSHEQVSKIGYCENVSRYKCLELFSKQSCLF